MFKSFFPKAGTPNIIDNSNVPESQPDMQISYREELSIRPFSVRVAVYDSFTVAPRTFDISSEDFAILVEQIAAQVYTYSHEKGGTIPYVVLREAIENLIHADFKNAVITVMPDGNTIKISDHGPGITDKKKVFLPGFSTADEESRKYIKGVGSGLPIVSESLKLMGGNVTIEDNLKEGSVITLSMNIIQNDQQESMNLAGHHAAENPSYKKQDLTDPQSKEFGTSTVKIISATPSDEKPESLEDSTQTSKEIDKILSIRQKKVFLLIAETGEIGPSTVTKELEMSLSTAYRDLVILEDMGLVTCTDSGKRKITNKGIEYLGFIFS